MLQCGIFCPQNRLLIGTPTPTQHFLLKRKLQHTFLHLRTPQGFQLIPRKNFYGIKNRLVTTNLLFPLVCITFHLWPLLKRCEND